MSVKHDHYYGHDDTDKSTLQPTQKKGWRFATESSWTLWHTGGTRQGHPYTSVSTEEGRGWPDVKSTVRPTTNDNKTKTSLESNVLSQPGAVRQLESYM